jgi:hypothetical protein
VNVNFQSESTDRVVDVLHVLPDHLLSLFCRARRGCRCRNRDRHRLRRVPVGLHEHDRADRTDRDGDRVFAGDDDDHGGHLDRVEGEARASDEDGHHDRVHAVHRHDLAVDDGLGVHEHADELCGDVDSLCHLRGGAAAVLIMSGVTVVVPLVNSCCETLNVTSLEDMDPSLSAYIIASGYLPPVHRMSSESNGRLLRGRRRSLFLARTRLSPRLSRRWHGHRLYAYRVHMP